MAATVERSTQEADISLTPRDDLSGEYAVASEGVFDGLFYTIVTDGIRTFDSAYLLPATVSQADGYAEKAGILPDFQIILYYGYLREGYFAWPMHDAQAGMYLYLLSDQQMFALALLLSGARGAYTRYISQYPQIF